MRSQSARGVLRGAGSPVTPASLEYHFDDAVADEDYTALPPEALRDPTNARRSRPMHHRQEAGRGSSPPNRHEEKCAAGPAPPR